MQQNTRKVLLKKKKKIPIVFQLDCIKFICFHTYLHETNARQIWLLAADFLFHSLESGGCVKFLTQTFPWWKTYLEMQNNNLHMEGFMVT